MLGINDDDVLLGLAVVSAILTLIRSTRSAGLRQMGDLRALALAVLAVLACVAGLYLWHGSGAGAIGLGLFLVLIWLPYRSLWLAASLMRAGRFRAAQAAMVSALILHPSRYFRAYLRLIVALQRIDCDDPRRAQEQLQAINSASSMPPLLRQIASVHLARLDGDWARIAALPTEPMLLGYQLIALGEVGDVAGMIRACREAGGVAAVARIEPVAVVSLLAFGGRAETVHQLLEGALRWLPPDARALWTATADLAAERNRAEALETCTRLSKASSNVEIRHRAAKRLARPPEPPRLTPDEQALLDEAEALLDTAGDSALVPSRWPLVTACTIAANVAMFAAEHWLGGSTNPEALYELGGLWLWPSVIPLEPWRAGTALFLHNGTAHILVNMLALAVFGTRIESRLGHLRFLALYLGAGVASNASLVGLTFLGVLRPNTLVVGASGAIMALVGALAALALRAWRRDRAAARRNLAYAVLIVCLEGAADTLIPNVSFTAHLCGAVAGFLITLVMPLQRVARDPAIRKREASRT
jgi:rhomboid protease GluP